jgi:hypothetical protein
LIQARIGNTLEVICIGKDFLSGTPGAQQLRECIGTWDLIKVKTFCSTKEMFSKLKRPPHRVVENICQLHIRQRTDNQNIQETQKIKLSPN